MWTRIGANVILYLQFFFPLYCDGSAYAFVHPAQKLVDPSSCPSVCPHVSERLQLRRFPWHLTLETFMNIFWEISNLVKNREKYLEFYIHAQLRPTEELLRTVWPSSELKLDSPVLRHPPLSWCLSTYITIKCQNLIWKIKHIDSTLMKYDHRTEISVGTRDKTFLVPLCLP